MRNNVTIVMYHYVRHLAHSRFPEIKGLPLEKFKQQLVFFQRNYHVVTMEEVIHASLTGDSLPENALLLTFDDGYLDHFLHVFPLLNEFNFQGSFFPPVKVISDKKVLDVNKIHFVLANAANKHELISEIFLQLDLMRSEYDLHANDYYYEKLAIPGRFDTAEVIFIKRLLQRELPEHVRARIVDHLFKKFVSEDEVCFASELYMSYDQLTCLRRNGMFIGSHTVNHRWLDSLNEADQEKEIVSSLDFLKKLGCDVNNWVMCYPYGAYNDTTLKILQSTHCKLALSTIPMVADLKSDKLLALPRLDTNDIKFS